MGALCLLCALGLTGYNMWDEQRASQSVVESAEQLNSVIRPKGEAERLLIPKEQVVMATVPLDGRNYIGVLEIPSLGLSLPILDECTDSLLKVAPCRYAGNLYDGLTIAGHNYVSHFKKLSQLVAGDAIRFTDVEGNVWNYTVTTTEVLSGYDVEGMEEGDWDLTLFTCTYSGQDRVTIRCTMEIM